MYSSRDSDYDTMSYAELQQEIRNNSMQYGDLTMKRQEAELKRIEEIKALREDAIERVRIAQNDADIN